MVIPSSASIAPVVNRGVGWLRLVCTADNGSTESEVEAFVTNDAIDLAQGSMVAGDTIVTTATDQDTLRDLSCQTGDVPKWDTVLNEWTCGVDSDSLSQVCGDSEIWSTIWPRHHGLAVRTPIPN